MRYLAGLTAVLALALAVSAEAQRPAAPRPRAAAPTPTAAPTPMPKPKEAVVPFATGETLTYDVSWSGLLTAGTAVTRVVQKRPSYGGTAFEITADGRPMPLLARIYPVYYKMDTLLDSTSLLSQWTGLYTEERARKRQTSMHFDRGTQVVHYEMTTEPAAKADVSTVAGVQDGLSLLYAIRTHAFRAGERFTVPVADDGSLYTVSFETTGPEVVAVKLGAIEAWSLKVTILDAQQQPAGKNIALWISTDARHLPVKIQADLPVGSFVLSLRDAQSRENHAQRRTVRVRGRAHRLALIDDGRRRRAPRRR